MLFTALTENVMISLWLSYACSCLLSGSYLLFCQLLVVWHWHQWLKLLLIGKKIVMTLWTCLCGADDSLVPWKSLLFYMLSILPLFGATFFLIERGKKLNYFSSTVLKTISYGRGSELLFRWTMEKEEVVLWNSGVAQTHPTCKLG